MATIDLWKVPSHRCPEIRQDVWAFQKFSLFGGFRTSYSLSSASFHRAAITRLACFLNMWTIILRDREIGIKASLFVLLLLSVFFSFYLGGLGWFGVRCGPSVSTSPKPSPLLRKVECLIYFFFSLFSCYSGSPCYGKSFSLQFEAFS